MGHEPRQKDFMILRKILVVLIALFFTIVMGLVIYFIVFLAFDIYTKYTNLHPEHPIMPLGAAIYAIYPTIPISIFLFVKNYKWLAKKYL